MTVLLLGEEGKRKAIFLVLCMLLALAPVSNVNAEDIGDPVNLQAQDIVAVFDPASETTTVTWRNIDVDSSVLQGLFTATYNVYRSDQPITPATIDSLAPFATNITACSSFEVGNDAFQCRGLNGTVADHSASFLVSPGVNQSFYYGITTTLGDGTEVFDLDANASSLAEPVLEQTTPIRTPYNIVSSFDPETSQTTVQWINYNDIVPILPESGDDAYRIQLYRTSSPVSRANTSILNNFQTENWELPAGTSQYVLDIPPNTDREVYYSVNYLLPNWTDGTTDYEDLRFLSYNAMSTPLREDNSLSLIHI